LPGRDAIYWRRLPHLRLGEATYFVTWRLRAKQRELSDGERDMVATALRKFDDQRYRLIGFVIMNDHVHVVVKPLGGNSLTGIVHAWKSFTANRLQRCHQRVGGIWGREYFDRVIRDERELADKLQYVLDNPRKRWPEVKEYRWAWISEREP